ncbi:hypothetical protein HYPSUDRAFT_52683 [Hypholoma sublateritium FD-334 SS-4]|uniref:Uncharacterized protein n=1 Tax=Hypholoma sublateritium (strain FD-334 SS-4) TaxID=945553 RepID=A0A0D2PCX6_HYPSF|nr:hypothetical protein HYPSUDRAFT_52683 [Hypholoma sublateritium FD-334 SS-4]
MHVRDEQISNKEARLRLKRQFETQTKAALQEAERNRAAAAQIRSSSESTNLPEAAGGESSEAGAATTIDTPTTAAAESQQQDTAPVNSFRRLVEEEINRVDLDEDIEDVLDEFIFPSGPGLGTSTPQYRKKKISELFEFTNDHWAKFFEKHAIRTFDEELEIYELLDMDAEGDDDDVEIDETTAQILVG